MHSVRVENSVSFDVLPINLPLLAKLAQFCHFWQTFQPSNSALVRLTQEQGACRPAIGNFGGLKVFVANLRKTGGHTKDGLPFLKCIDCCTREAINRNRIRELGVFDIWKDILDMDRKEHGDPDGLLLKAQNIILFSLTNFYYDDDRKFYKILSFF